MMKPGRRHDERFRHFDREDPAPARALKPIWSVDACAIFYSGREPKDYDVATNATPQQVMRIFPETYAVGAQFGVVLVPRLSRRCFRVRSRRNI